MLSKTEKSFSLLFFVILTIDLICGSQEHLIQFRYITKPLVLITLIIFFLRMKSQLSRYTKNMTLIALVLSLLGDILLMFEDRSPIFFTLGLGSFLMAHIVYALIFLQQRNSNNGLWGFIALLILYASGLFYLIGGGLGTMLIPVVLYVIAIFSMATSAYSRKGNVTPIGFYFVFIGAILFMVSDSLIALHKFYRVLPFSSITIMLTYGLAQLLIVLGILRYQD